jgi:hypothetical protein
MSLMDTLGDLGSVTIGFVLTLLVFSFVLRDNPLYRLAVHLLVGVAAGYAAVVTLQGVVFPVFTILLDGQGDQSSTLWLVPLFLALLLILKLARPAAWLGNSAMGVLIAIGATVGLVGAIQGTLLPQITAGLDDAILGVVAALLTVCTLVYFHFTGRLSAAGEVMLPVWQKYVGFVGQLVIVVTLGALFAGVLNTSLVLVAERLNFFVESFVTIFESLLS